MKDLKYLDASDLPKEWKAARFGELVDYRIGRTPPRNEKIHWDNGMYPWVSIADMKPYATITETSENVSEEAFGRIFRSKLVPAGSLLMSFKLTIGRVARLGIPAFHNEAIISFRPEGDRVDEDYLAYYLSQINYKDYQDTAIKGQTLNSGKIDSLEIALPPLSEQRRITHVLGTVQQAIEQQERLIRSTTELKQALMQKLFTEGLRGEAQKETEIGLVPESWEVVALREVCDFQSGGTPSKQKPEYWIGTIPWASPKDMKRPRLRNVTDHISNEGLKTGSRLAPEGAVFIVIRGMILAKDVPVALAEAPMAINQDMKAIIPGPSLRGDYLLYALAANKEKIFHLVGRSAHGTMTLMSEDIYSFQIPLPTKTEQNEIANAFFTLEKKVEQHNTRRTALQDLFRTLLHELMTGKVRVPDLN